MNDFTGWVEKEENFNNQTTASSYETNNIDFKQFYVNKFLKNIIHYKKASSFFKIKNKSLPYNQIQNENQKYNHTLNDIEFLPIN